MRLGTEVRTRRRVMCGRGPERPQLREVAAGARDRRRERPVRGAGRKSKTTEKEI